MSSVDSTLTTLTSELPGPGVRRAAMIIGLTVLAVLVAGGGWFVTTGLLGRQALNVTAQGSAAGVDRVRIDGANAGLTVTAGDDGEIRVHATGSYSGAEPEVSVRVDNGQAVIALRCRNQWLRWCSIDADIELPGGLPLTAATDDGKIDISGVTADLDLATDNGRLEIAGGSGRVTAVTDNGDVSIRNSRSTDVSIRTDNGGVDVELLGVPQHLQAETDNGDVDLAVDGDAKYEVQTHSDNGDVKVEVGVDSDAVNHIKATTDNGDIRVHPSS